MTRRILLATAVALSIATLSAAQDGAPLAINGLDPVRLSKGEEVTGQADLHVAYEGLTYRFASQQSLDAFNADPERWAAQFDGACGHMRSMAGDPSIFAVHDGRLYLFGAAGCRAGFLASPANFTGEARTVAILVYEGVELLDFAGPGEVFSAAHVDGGFDVFTVAVTAEPVLSQGFVTITPEHSIETAPIPDILVIPGGGVGNVMHNEALLSWVRRVHDEGDHIMSVCNGALVLAELGYLEGLEVATHHSVYEALRGYPGVTVVETARYIDNGKIITTAGVSAGIDGALYVVEQLLGSPAARMVSRYMEYDTGDRSRTNGS
jgi:putative intracellular protease/amidase